MCGWLTQSWVNYSSCSSCSLSRILKPCIHECAAYTLCICMRSVFAARLINFPRTWGEQRTPGAWKGHPAHPVFFVFTQKTDKFQYAANGMQTIRGWRSIGSQSRPHIRSFGLRTIHKRFANHSACSCIQGFTQHTFVLLKNFQVIKI